MAILKLVDRIAEDILNDISKGLLKPGHLFGSEAEVGVSFGVSRLTVREAFRTLRSQGVLISAQGLGTTVAPISEWTSLKAVITVLSQQAGVSESAIHLLELRRMIETGSAEQAALRRSADDLEQLEEAIDEMRSAHTEANVKAFAEADLRFHDVVMKATNNPLVVVTMHQLSELLFQDRSKLSIVFEVREHAIRHHELIVDEITKGDAEGSRKAMDAHLLKTIDDVVNLISSVESVS